MYLKAVSELQHDNIDNEKDKYQIVPNIWFSPHFEEFRYQANFVTDYNDYEDFLNNNDTFVKSNYYTYISGNFALETDKVITEGEGANKEGTKVEKYHPYFQDHNDIGVGLFRLDGLKGHPASKTYIFAGVKIYLLNDDGDTLESIDLSK